MRARNSSLERMRHVATVLACLLLALLAPSACARLEVGIEGTPTADVATQATVAALAEENVKLATQVARLQTAMPPTATPPESEVSPTAAPEVSAAPATPTPLPPTPTPLPPTPLPPTPIPPTPIPPTPIPPTPLPPAVRITFEPGATCSVIEGDVPAGGVDLYVLHASAGQLLEVSLPSHGGSPRFSVYGSDGTVLKSDASATGAYRGSLPSTQDYFIQIEGGGAPANYTLSVVIPQRIEFQPGATCANIEHTVVPGRTDYYVVRILSGQLLDASVYTPASDVRLVIYGADGTVLKSGMGGGPGFRGTVPVTQDYIMHVTSNLGTGYRLNVTIPERISFDPGSTSATLGGPLAAYDTHHYVIRAMAGQTMMVRVSAPGDAIRLVIYGVDGTVLRSGMAAGATFTGTLPSTQDYLIHLTSDTAVAWYTMEVTIPAPSASGTGSGADGGGGAHASATAGTGQNPTSGVASLSDRLADHPGERECLPARHADWVPLAKDSVLDDACQWSGTFSVTIEK